ncbi:DNA-3-methyladenine glycosylase I [Actinosynnema sp. NPDC047251]|uniref:DNA-3-methyladenine glycosylase I n=1 Tax=Saccharothrix espanaensis (strain ATCC 51144 / DSM 44229 / JCM 9112 / NBRC 15066 / NRRL 15764) TaxID=1179773 RepID=K0JRX0_SACES|nr:DNA-3-methyladenine glycosylase I [Saccharothrix espanaensis]CCH28197.1 DNA-3-methyladenine glycosylase I [Saccharothrix espanaensis DSM 44229]
MIRCPWGDSTPDYHDYHDTEWGVELHGDVALFERMCLESFQSGLSWITILRKRENFRTAFDGFVPAVVAEYGQDDFDRLMADAGIVRNRAKINATINNARAVGELDVPLDDLLWSFAPETHERPATFADVPAVTAESKAMAKELKRRGFVFLGPTTCYALMQATGMVDDHIAACFRAHEAVSAR